MLVRKLISRGLRTQTCRQDLSCQRTIQGSFCVLSYWIVASRIETITLKTDEAIGSMKSPFILHNATTMSLFPNPVERGQEVSIYLHEIMDEATIEVIDMTGRVIVVRGIEDAKQGFSTEGMASGVYTVRIISGNAVTTSKLVVR